ILSSRPNRMFAGPPVASPSRLPDRAQSRARHRVPPPSTPKKSVSRSMTHRSETLVLNAPERNWIARVGALGECRLAMKLLPTEDYDRSLQPTRNGEGC